MGTENKVIYEDTSYKNLGLAIINSDIDVTELSVIRKISNDNVEFGILGASHYVKFKNGEKWLTEIFACRKLKGSNVRYYPLDSLSKITTHTMNSKYEFNVQVMTRTEEVEELMGWFKDELEQRPENTLKEVFPFKGTPRFEPATYINVVVNDEISNISVKTVHAYPEDNIVVYTESKLNINQ